MTLDDYFKSEADTPAELARKTGLSAASITRILFGEQNPSHDAIKAIVRATGGLVTADDLIFGAPRDSSEKRKQAPPEAGKKSAPEDHGLEDRGPGHRQVQDGPEAPVEVQVGR